MIKIYILIVSFFACTAQARILVESNGQKVRHNYDTSADAREVGSFWQSHKMGVGLHFAGSQGLAGGVLAFNFHPQWGAELSFGGGPHFQSFGFRAKHLLLNSSIFHPYVTGGFSRWLRTKGPVNTEDITPSFVPKKLMSSEERRLGRIDAPLITSAVGLQYIFTKGELKGVGINLEGDLLFDIRDFVFVPTASVGMNYYF